MFRFRWAMAALLLAAAPLWAQGPNEDLTPKQIAERLKTVPEGEAGNRHLETLAKEYQDAIAKGKEDAAAAKDKLEGATEDEAKSALQKQIDEWDAKEPILAKRLGEVVRVMRARDMETTELEAQLIPYGIVLGVSADVALNLLDKWFNKGKTWLVDEGPGLIGKLLLFIVILIVFKILANILGRITRSALSTSRLKTSGLLKEFFVNIASKVTFFVGLIIALGSIGIDIGPLLAGIGVLGFVVGFALQETLANFAAGVMILLYRPYDVGDVVTAAGVTGKVEAMSLVSTTVGLFDNQVVVIPNGKIWGNVITNITSRPTRRVDMTFGVSYSDDLDKVEKLLTEIITSHPKVLKDPAPVVKMHALADSSVNFIARPWAKTAEYWDVYWDVHKAVKQRFDAEGVSIPFPQRDVHLFHESNEAALATLAPASGKTGGPTAESGTDPRDE